MPPPPPSPIVSFQRQILKPLFAFSVFSYIPVNNLFDACRFFSHLSSLQTPPSPRTSDGNIIGNNIHSSAHMHPSAWHGSTFNKAPFIRMLQKQSLTQTCRKLEFSLPYGSGFPRGNHYLIISMYLLLQTPNTSQLFQQNRVLDQIYPLESFSHLDLLLWGLEASYRPHSLRERPCGGFLRLLSLGLLFTSFLDLVDHGI